MCGPYRTPVDLETLPGTVPDPYRARAEIQERARGRTGCMEISEWPRAGHPASETRSRAEIE